MTRYFQDSDSCTDSHQICEYENLGKELMGAIMAYGQHLRQKHIAGPSPSLGGWKIMQSSNQEIIQEKNRVVELAQRLLAMTQDPATSLLLDSLQVFPIFHSLNFLSEIT